MIKLVKFISLLLITLFFQNNECLGKEVFAYATIHPFTGEKLKDHGLMSKILTETLKDSDIEFKFVKMPFARMINSLKDGKITGTPVLWKRKHREPFVYYSPPIFPTYQILYYRASQFKKIETLEDALKELKRYKIAAPRGYALSKNLKLNSKSQVTRTNSDIEAFSMLNKGRVDFIITEYYSVKYLLAQKKLKIDEKNLKTIRVSTEWEYIGISKKAKNGKKIHSHISKRIIEMKKSGRIEELIQEYFNF